MLLQTSFQFNLVTAVKIKHTLHCLYIDLCEESLVFVVVVFKTSMLDWRGVHWSKIGLSAKFGVAGIQGISALLPVGDGGRTARRSAKIRFNNNITYYSWQIWALIVEICNCDVGVLWGFFGGVKWVSRGLHLTWLNNANWLFTTRIIQK